MDMYMERILELYRKPLNFGEIHDAQVKKTDYNPSCGDMVSMFVKLETAKRETGGGKPADEGARKVVDAKFKGHGCAISTASASLLTGAVKGKTISEIEKMGQKEIFALIGIDLSKNPSRLKCAMLPLTVLKQGIKEMKK